MLVEHGANVEARSADGWTPLLYASALGDLRLLYALLDKGADIETIDGNGMNPLIGAVVQNKPEVVKLLLSRGADVSKRVEGVTLLAIAEESSVEIAEMLRRAGAE